MSSLGAILAAMFLKNRASSDSVFRSYATLSRQTMDYGSIAIARLKNRRAKIKRRYRECK
jgi:uncharacterized protein YutE (UPF0331/DUF86 family)